MERFPRDTIQELTKQYSILTDDYIPRYNCQIMEIFYEINDRETLDVIREKHIDIFPIKIPMGLVELYFTSNGLSFEDTRRVNGKYIIPIDLTIFILGPVYCGNFIFQQTDHYNLYRTMDPLKVVIVYVIICQSRVTTK